MWNPITEFKKMVAFLKAFVAMFFVIREAQKLSKQIEAVNAVAMMGEEAENGKR